METTLPDNRSLYQIGSDMEALADLLYECGGDVTDAEAEAAVNKWLVENEFGLKKKIDGYAEIIRRFETMSAEANEEANRLKKLAAIRDNAAARLKEGLRLFMERHSIHRIDTELHRFTLCANGGKEPVQVDPEYLDCPANLPAKYQKVITTIKPNLETIRADIENGVPVAFARIGPRGNHLRIK